MVQIQSDLMAVGVRRCCSLLVSALCIVLLADAEAVHQRLRRLRQPDLLQQPGARVLELDDDGIREVAYEESGCFTLTKQFLEGHAAMLRHLLAD